MTLLMMSLGLFAQVKSTGLTDNDVKNFIKNYQKIEKDLERIGLEVDSSAFETWMEYEEVESILEKNGISGPNRCYKVVMIVMCTSVAVGEEEMGAMDAETMEMLKSMGMEDPLAMMRAQINDADYKIVKKYVKAITEVLEL